MSSYGRGGVGPAPGSHRGGGFGGGGAQQHRPPRDYVPGIGRGAAGFTTRSDVGPAVAAPTAANSGSGVEAATGGSRAADARAARLQQQSSSQFGVAPTGYIPGAGRGASSLPGGDKKNEAGGPVGAYDSFGGYTERPAAAASAAEGQYDDGDDEADQIWDAIDARMNRRPKRKKRKTNSVDDKDKNQDDNEDEDEDTEAGLTSQARIGAQFRELKDQLSSVTEDEWANIPDVGDYSLKYKQNRSRKQDVFTPLSDSLLEQRSLSNRDATASAGASSRMLSATTTVAANDESASSGFKSVVTNMSGLSAARGTMLGMSLDKMSHAVAETAASSGTATITAGGKSTTIGGKGRSTSTAAFDKEGYLTSLATVTGSTTTLAPGADVGDIHKARLLLKSVRETNPKHGPGWIASARVEEAAGKILQARKIIQEGCEACPTVEDVWLEAVRLHPKIVAKSILATAARRIPTSVKIFLKAADLEDTNEQAKKAVLRKGLEANPTSVTLWKAAIDLEEAEDARILLSVAVEKIPHSVEMWLALARLETYSNAQRVLNKARKALPTDRTVWIAAAKLEESQNLETGADRVDKVMHRAVKSLAKNDAIVSRAQWLEEAEKSERAGAPLTSAAIVKHTIGMDVDDEDRQRTWAEDAKSSLARGSVATARAILAHALAAFPNKRTLWMQTIDLERKHGTPESLNDVLAAASERLPRTEIIWLLWAKERWLAGDVDKARQVLTEAFKVNPDSEAIWLAAAKLELENGEIVRARVLLQRARERAPTARVFMKSALLEREQGAFDDSLRLIQEGLKTFPKFAKLYMMGGQICSDDLEPKSKRTLERARKFYQRGLEHCTDNIALWILASRLEERASTFLTLESANDASAAVGFTKARSLLELSRLKNPQNPALWLEAIRLERRATTTASAAASAARNSLMAKALQECPTSGLLWAEQIRTAPRVERKSKAALAIKKCPEDAHVLCAVAEFFASKREILKARKWLDRAVVLDPHFGDGWARYYAFETKQQQQQQQQQGKKDSNDNGNDNSSSGDCVLLNQVRERCIAAEPKYGEIWTSVSKDMSNRHKIIKQILELAAQKVLDAQSE